MRGWKHGDFALAGEIRFILFFEKRNIREFRYTNYIIIRTSTYRSLAIVLWSNYPIIIDQYDFLYIWSAGEPIEDTLSVTENLSICLWITTGKSLFAKLCTYFSFTRKDRKFFQWYLPASYSRQEIFPCKNLSQHFDYIIFTSHLRSLATNSYFY